MSATNYFSREYFAKNQRVFLAPMEGLLDFELRQILCYLNSDNALYDAIFTPFVRISNSVLPDYVYTKMAPELLLNSQQRPKLIVQLLGSNAKLLAENAFNLSQLSPDGIDLNFGCPSPTVNRHGGGAELLKNPDLIFEICQQVRRAVPPNISVSAKIRLGIENTNSALLCSQAVISAGLNFLTIHARTKTEMYQKIIHYDVIAEIAEKFADFPIIANGEIWSLQDAKNCQNIAKTSHFMLGRGAVSNPLLICDIKNLQNLQKVNAENSWQKIADLLSLYAFKVRQRLNSQQTAGRIKLWLKYLSKNFYQAADLYQQIIQIKFFEDFPREIRKNF